MSLSQISLRKLTGFRRDTIVCYPGGISCICFNATKSCPTRASGTREESLNKARDNSSEFFKNTCEAYRREIDVLHIWGQSKRRETVRLMITYACASERTHRRKVSLRWGAWCFQGKIKEFSYWCDLQIGPHSLSKCLIWAVWVSAQPN